jgi:signal transduction histidine kinase
MAKPAPPGAASHRGTGASQARAELRLRVALIGLFAGLGLAASLAWLVPSLAALESSRSGVVRLFAIVLGAAVATAVAIFGPSGEPPGARLATRIGTIASLTGISASLLAGLAALSLAGPLGIPFDRATMAALTAGGIGASLVVAILAAVACTHGADRTSAPSTGVTLRVLIAGATGALTVSTWALSAAYLIGHQQATSRQTSVAEARDLAILLASLSPAALERLSAELTPPGGFVARIDAEGVVIPGVGTGAPRDARVSIIEDDLCRVGERGPPLPCAIHPLPDGTRLTATVSEVPIPIRLLVVFVLVGVAATVVAIGIGATLARGTADELHRVAAALDELGAGQGGLDRPIPAVSLDEVGDLAVALARLRVRLRPGLVEHDEALARARGADRERDQFLALVSDELRAPLDRILGSARLLLEGKDPLTASQREDVRLIVSSSTHLTELIEEVLDLSAIATGQIRLRMAEVDLSTLASDVARAQRPLLGKRKVELHLELPSEPVRIVADERRVRQVLTNLVSNAVKFTTEGSITVSLVRVQDGWLLSVADTGPGIAAEQLPKLFSEFVQLGSLRQRARGTGLGLAICKRLIDAHHGTITAESELGVGTKFSVRLPTGEARE